MIADVLEKMLALSGFCKSPDFWSKSSQIE
jgi:hypothetical protein